MSDRIGQDPSGVGIKNKMLSWLRFSNKKYSNSHPVLNPTVETQAADRLRSRSKDQETGRIRSASSERFEESKPDSEFRRSLRYRNKDKENFARKSILKYSSSNLLHSSGDEAQRKSKGHITFDDKLLPRTSTTLALACNANLPSMSYLSPIPTGEQMDPTRVQTGHSRANPSEHIVPSQTDAPRLPPKIGCQLGCPVSPDLKTICSECLYRDTHKSVGKKNVQKTTSGQAGLRRLKLLKENQELLMADDEASLVSTFEATNKTKPGRIDNQNKASVNREKVSTIRCSKTVKKIEFTGDQAPVRRPESEVLCKAQVHRPENKVLTTAQVHKLESKATVPNYPVRTGRPLVDHNGRNTCVQVHLPRKVNSGPSTSSENKPWYDVENSLEKMTNRDRSFGDLSVLVERAVKDSLEKILAKSIFPIICSPSLAASILNKTTDLVKSSPRSRPLPPTPQKLSHPLYENIEALSEEQRSFSAKSFPAMTKQETSPIQRSSSLPAIQRSDDQTYENIVPTSDYGDYVDLKTNKDLIPQLENSLYVNVHMIESKDSKCQDSQLCTRGEASGVSATSGVSASDSWEDTPPEFSSGSGASVRINDQGLQRIKKLGVSTSPVKKSPGKKFKYKAQEVLCGKAKLKLQMYTNNGLLTIHIIRASQLASNRSHQVNAYVKISLEPDPAQTRQWRSKVVRGASSPLFNQKITIEVTTEDENKRLLFSLWHRDVINKRSEFLGCMTFGLGHILRSRQVVHGWYRILTLALGSQKHFAVNKPPPNKALPAGPKEPGAYQRPLHL